jgi:hypothetical protein
MVVTQKLVTFLASLLTRLRSIVLSLVLLALVAWNFGAINTSANEVLGMVSHIQQFEASGVKVVLRDDAKFKATLALVADNLSDAEKRATLDAVQKLTGPQAERLFTIENGQSHCDYTDATPKMRMYAYTDVALGELSLVDIKDDPAGLKREMVRTAHGSDIGKPRSCYSMKLTDRGYNAKSALVGIIRQQIS